MTEPSRTIRRIGLLIPSSNTVVEPEAARLIPPDGSITLHVSRFRVTVISNDAVSLRQFEREAMLEAALLLADAKVDRIAWAGTAASWLGFDRDRSLAAAIQQRTGIPATTAVLAVNARLRGLGARRIALVTPYIADLESRIIENYRRSGIDVIDSRRLDLTVNTEIAEIGEPIIEEMVRAVAAAAPDAIVIMCTNLRFGVRSSVLSSNLGLPVIDSVAETVAACLAGLQEK